MQAAAQLTEWFGIAQRIPSEFHCTEHRLQATFVLLVIMTSSLNERQHVRTVTTHEPIEMSLNGNGSIQRRHDVTVNTYPINSKCFLVMKQSLKIGLYSFPCILA